MKSPSQKIQITLIFLLIAAATFLAYLPCLKNDFVNWDDDKHLLENPYVRSLGLDNIKNIFTTTVNRTYIPLTTLSFALEYHFFNYKPFIYHLTNVVLHALITGLVFILGWRLGLSLFVAAVSALFFGVHPMHVESVAWVTERKDVLYAFFYMLAILSYWQYLITQKKSRFIWSLVFGLLSILSKPMALSLPLILLLCDWFYNKKLTVKNLTSKIPYFLFIVPITWLTYSLNARVPISHIVEAPLIWMWTFVFYLRQFVFPVTLIPLYQLPQPVSLLSFHYFLPTGIFLLVAAAIFYFRKNSWFVFAFAFFFFSIFFLLRFDSRVDVTLVSDRFMYLPSVGFSFLFGIAFQFILKKLEEREVDRATRGVLVVCLFLFLGLVSIKTFLQCTFWQNGITLWNYQLEHAPQTAIALNNLATAYTKEDNYKKIVEKYRQAQKEEKNTVIISKEEDILIKKIIALYEKAIKLNPQYNDALYNLGSMYQDVLKSDEALEMYKKTIEADPQYIQAYYNAGKVYHDAGNYNEALNFYRKSIELDLGFKDGYFGLANLYRDMHKPSEAVKYYKNAIEMDPTDEDVYISVIKAYTEALAKGEISQDFNDAREETVKLYQQLIAKRASPAVSYFNLGTLYYDMGEYQQSIDAFKKALTIAPHNEKIVYNLANTYLAIGEYSEAVSLYQKAIMLNSRREDSQLNCGIALYNLGRYREAIGAYQKALAINPNYANAYYDLGLSLEKVGQAAQAVDAYRNAIRVDPLHVASYFNLGNINAVLKRYSDAVWYYEKALNLKPDYLDALVNAFIFSMEGNNYTQAASYYERAKRLGYQIPEEYKVTLKKQGLLGK